MFTHRHDGLTRNEPRPSAEADLCAAAPRARCALRYCPSPPLKFSPTVPAVDLVDCVGRVLELRTLDLATQPPPSPGPAALPVVGYDFLALYLSVTEEFDDNVQVLEVLERFEQDCASLEEALSRLWDQPRAWTYGRTWISWCGERPFRNFPGSFSASCRMWLCGALPIGASVSASGCRTPTARWSW